MPSLLKGLHRLESGTVIEVSRVEIGGVLLELVDLLLGDLQGFTKRTEVFQKGQ